MDVFLKAAHRVFSEAFFARKQKKEICMKKKRKKKNGAVGRIAYFK